MKHLVFLLLCCMIAISGSAKVNRIVDYVSDGMIISYDLSAIEVSELKGVYEFNLDGFSHVHSEGVPNVLYRNETFMVPAGYEVSKVEPIVTYRTLSGTCSMSTPHDYSNLSIMDKDEEINVIHSMELIDSKVLKN